MHSGACTAQHTHLLCACCPHAALQFRPVKDLKETLLHEMIHAALFLCNVRDDGDHGPKFRALMNRINNATCADSQVTKGYSSRIPLVLYSG